MTEAVQPTGPLLGPLRKRESRLWTRQPEDWYIEPEWCSARLFAVEAFSGDVFDPACGSGRIVRSAVAAGLNAYGADVVDRKPEIDRFQVQDFFRDLGHDHDNIVSNPPFGVAEKFVERALRLTARKTAMLLPANWVQGDKRSRWLEKTPLRRVYFLTPRPSMPPGHIVAAGDKPGNGTTDYAWFVWLQGYDGAPEVRWLRREP